MRLSLPPVRHLGALALGIVTLAAVLGASGCVTPAKQAVKPPAQKPPAVATPATKGVPATVMDFAREATGTRIFYPAKLPEGWKYLLAEVTPKESDGYGPTIDIGFGKGDLEMWITQGSPVMRDYEIQSLGKTAFGTGMADLIWEDPEAPGEAQMIVYVEKGNLVEMYGNGTIEDLKALAAAMEPVK